MATLISGLGGVAGYGEQSMRTLGVTAGNLDDGSRFVDATSVFGSTGINFYGTNYTGFYLNTNGILTFSSAYTTYTPSAALTSVGQPNIAAFWTDIDINKGGEIYWDLDPANGRIIVTWASAAPYSGTGTVSFQIVLSNLGGGDLGVQFIYSSIGYTGSGGGAATIGLSNGSTLQTLAEGSSNATIIAGYATNDFDTNDPAGVWGANFEGGTLQTGNGIVDGTAGDDLINTAYVGDPQGDRIDNWDANGFSGTTGQGDYVLAGAGNDTVLADHGNDQVFGGSGNDSLSGGYGNDSIDGGSENDSIDGGSSNDTLLGGLGDDTLIGGAGAAAIAYTASFTEVTSAHQSITGTSGRPNFNVRSQSGDGLTNLTTGTNGAVSGFLLGDVDWAETHTHEASAQIQSSQINFNGIDSNETLTISIDGVAVNLNTLITSGAVTFNNAAGAYAIDASGRIIRTGGAASTTDVGSLVINTPHTTVSLTSAGSTGTAGMHYEYFVNTAPVNIAAEIGGNDSLLGQAGNDQLFGGDGSDTLDGGADQDTLDGGIGNDSLLGDAGNDSLLGQAGNDQLFGGDGNDTLDGGADNDQLYGGADADSLAAGLGDDLLDGGAGNDTLTGDAGNDTLQGGDGADLFFGGAGDVVTGGEGGTDNDILRITASFYNIIYGGGSNEAGTVQFLDAAGGNVIGSLTFSEIENVMCFTPGARIQTARGQVLVERLRRGDLVMTRDHGLQPVAWIGRRDLGLGDLIANPSVRPIRINRGALGAGLPKRDLLVSPQHRMLMGGARAEMLFGEEEVLVAATHLTALEGVEQVLTHGVSYIHVMFDRHEIICAEGAWSESFQPSDRNISEMDQAQRDEIVALFPELAQSKKSFAAARMSLKSYEARALIAA